VKEAFVPRWTLHGLVKEAFVPRWTPTDGRWRCAPLVASFEALRRAGGKFAACGLAFPLAEVEILFPRLFAPTQDESPVFDPIDVPSVSSAKPS